MMKKNKIIMLFLVISLCFFSGIMGVKANQAEDEYSKLPPCNFESNGYGKLSINDFDAKEYCEDSTQNKITCMSFNAQTDATDSNGSKDASIFEKNDELSKSCPGKWTAETQTAEVYFLVSDRDPIKSLNFVIFAETDSETVARCRTVITPKNKPFYVNFLVNNGNIKYIAIYMRTKITNDNQNPPGVELYFYHCDKKDSSGKKITVVNTTASDKKSEVDYGVSEGRKESSDGSSVQDDPEGTSNDYYTGARQNANILYDAEKINCDKISGVASIIALCWKAVMILVPVVLIALGTLDFVKGFTSNSEDAVKKNVNNFVKRTIAALLLLYLPLIVGILVNLFGLVNYNCLFK